MLGLGSESRFLIFKETAFKQPWTTEARKRIALIEQGLELDKGFTPPNEITGVRSPLVNVPMRSQLSGGVNITAGPENGFAEFLAAACGGVVTLDGAFKREHATLAGSDHTLPHVPVTPGSDEVFVKAPAAIAWEQLTRVAGAPDPGEYSIDELTGEITFGENLTGYKLFATYCKEVAGVYSHIITPSDVPFFGLWDTKGGVDLFEFGGCAINSASLEASSEGFLGLNCDVLAAKELIASIDATGHTFPAGLRLSPLAHFKMSQARVFVDYTADARINKVSWEINNNLDPYWALNCDDSISKIYPAVQDNAVGFSVVFDTISDYAKFKREEFFSIELEYGACANTGVEIGETGENYKFYVHFPRYRFEGAPLPTTPGKMMLEGTGIANLDTGMDRAYKAVIVNGQPELFA